MAKYRIRNDARQQYNPLRGLSLSRLVAMEEAAERGDYADVQWLWHHMEQTDVTVSSAISRRLSSTNSLDWQIRTIETADPILAAEQAEILRYAYERIQNLAEAADRIAYGNFTGYSIFEKERTGYGPFIKNLHYIPCWHWRRDVATGRWYFDAEARAGMGQGEMADPRDLLIYQPQDPIFKSIGRHFFAKALALADWDVALENGANQAVFLVGPPGTTSEKELEYQALAEAMTSNLRGYLPNGADVKITDLAARSKMPYVERIDYADRQIVMAATGGLLTMLAESGSGTLAGNAHSDTLIGLASADAAKISEVFQRQIDREIVKAFFPGHPICVYFKFDIPEKSQSIAEITELISGLSWAGYRIDQQQLQEKLGFKLEQVPTPGA
jgi:phage gp29-like protein